MRPLRLLWLLMLVVAWPVPATVRQAPEPELRELMQRTVAEAESFQDRFDAEVWLLDMSTRLKRYVPDPQARLTLLRLVHQEASKAGLKPDIVLALIHAESHFDRFAISSVGAQGMMQVMPFWKAELGRPQDNLTDNATNLRYGCTILSYYLKKENGDINRALARYNGSLGKQHYPARVIGFWQDFWYVKP
ncbi:lytic transglycosylase domain-containing protein [Stutzerimonas stutzeri]|uniref:lytic transglycosylase domain-containing protein n=1 Tax=Stutzerimonas stutzeri TaxID=316 RepID=UPI00210B6B4D|nr:lytic transglycosylase domain-containing protein [Stutzerimonas stutzeri]MCQ4319755.1 lytic transglycosylase domain-containing protein [Stutzerimonas stutzeri]